MYQVRDVVYVVSDDLCTVCFRSNLAGFGIALLFNSTHSSIY